jgi:AdoMet-dependent heme synthase
VFWELTARCNLKCVHCRAEAGAEAASGELPTEDVLAAARDIREAGDPILVLTGGEPLVRDDFFDIARFCGGLFSRVALATNGTLVDAALARRIVEAGIRRISVSLDGATAASHDAFRGVPGSFERTLQGYDALSAAGASLQINATLTRRNAAEMEALLQLALARRAEAFHVFALVPVGCGARLSDGVRLNPRELESFLRWLLARSVELADRLHIKATCAPQYYRIMREAGGTGAPRPVGGAAHGMHAVSRGCLAGSGVCFVSRTGDVQPCGYLPIPVGNVRSQRFADIWRGSEVFSSLRSPAQLRGKCGRCGYRKLCAGCRARAFAETGDFLAEDPDCAYAPA